MAKTLKKEIEKSVLSSYLLTIRNYPVLSKEEEIELARKYRENGDVEAAKKLVLSNLRFVVKIALEYKDFGFNLLDLIQQGNLGLMMAVKKFDPEKGYKLISYAVWWIRAYIHNYIMSNYSIVKMGTTEAERKMFGRLKALKSINSNEDMKKVAEALNVNEKDVVEMEARLAKKDFSLDYELELEGGDRSRFIDVLVSDAPTPEEELAEIEDRRAKIKALEEAMKCLSPVEKFVIEKRWLEDTKLTLEEVGNILKLSKERVRQIEKQAMSKLRERVTFQSAVV